MSLVGFKARNHTQQTRKRGPNPKVDEMQTPPELFDPLHERYRFTLDACAVPRNAKLSRYYGPPDLSPTSYRCMWDHPDECGAGGCPNCPNRRQPPLALDGLAQSWRGERVWCNPPYSDIEPWVRKAWNADAQLVVMLVPANRTEQGWWQMHVEPWRDQGLLLRTMFIEKRQRFIRHGADGIKPNERPPFGVALLVWGEQ